MGLLKNNKKHFKKHQQKKKMLMFFEKFKILGFIKKQYLFVALLRFRHFYFYFKRLLC